MIHRKVQFLVLSGIVAVSVMAGMFLAGGLGLAPSASADPQVKPTPEVPPAYALPNFADLAERADPAVVSITSTTVTDGGSVLPGFEFFFRPQEQEEEPRRQDSGGSGFVISDDGYILTNFHVIEDADRVEVRLPESRREYRAEVIGTDPATDLALLKIDVDESLPVIPLGDSDAIRVGEWVVAIGNPYIWDHTLTVGVISATGRQLPGLGRDTSFDNFIQTDAAINFGNSGGPLLNLRGEAIGINTAISPQGQGIGFAIPINMAKQVMDQLKEHGRVSRGYLGISIQDIAQLPEEEREAFGLQGIQGAFVQSVTQGLPADRAGVQHGDAIVSVDGKPIDSSAELISEITRRSPNQKVALGVLRNGESVTLDARLVDREDASDASVPARAPEGGEDDTEELLGFRVESLTPENMRYYRLEEDVEGVIVTQVDPISRAFDKGMREGQVILEVNRAPVRSLADFRAQLEGTERGDLVSLYVQAGSVSRFVVLRYGEAD
ncbi:MAG: Do family serine endopeptidase [Acidobacteriota bacterium]|jgi:serine protease Do